MTIEKGGSAVESPFFFRVMAGFNRTSPGSEREVVVHRAFGGKVF